MLKNLTLAQIVVRKRSMDRIVAEGTLEYYPTSPDQEQAKLF